MSDILDRYEVESWSGKGRSEVQASWNDGNDRYEVRVCAYQPNGRFAQYPPHVSPDEETIEKLIEGIWEMAERAKKENLLNEMGEISDLVEEVGAERARELLEEAAEEGQSDQADPSDVNVSGRTG